MYIKLGDTEVGLGLGLELVNLQYISTICQPHVKYIGLITTLALTLTLTLGRIPP
jgi:hypothetical protein